MHHEKTHLPLLTMVQLGIFMRQQKHQQTIGKYVWQSSDSEYKKMYNQHNFPNSFITAKYDIMTLVMLTVFAQDQLYHLFPRDIFVNFQSKCFKIWRYLEEMSFEYKLYNSIYDTICREGFKCITTRTCNINYCGRSW